VLLFTSIRSDTDVFVNWFNDQHKEIIDEPVYLSIEGSIPSYINGELIRVGPSIANTDLKNYTNFLDSFGRITKWSLNGNNDVGYMSSLIKSSLYNSSFPYNQPSDIPRHVFQEQTIPKTHIGTFDFNLMDNTDVNVYKFPKETEILAMTDFHNMNKIDLKSLRTIGNVEFQDNNNDIPKGTLFSGSHPGQHIDETTGEIMIVNWLGSMAAGGFKLYIYKMGSDRKRHIIGSYKIKHQPYSIHSIGVSDGLATIIIGPVPLSSYKTAINLCLTCDASDKIGKESTQILMFNLEGNKLSKKNPPVANIIIPPEDSFFVFHYLNHVVSVNEYTTVSLDICAYNSMDGVFGEYVLGNIETLHNKEKRNKMPYNCNHIKRIEINVDTQEVIASNDLPMIDVEGNTYYIELASINPKKWGTNACYAYGVTYHIGGSTLYEDMGIVKMDLCTAHKISKSELQSNTPTINYFHKNNTYVGEPIFIARPGNNREDDGVLLVVSKDGISDKTRLLVIDAIDMTQIASIEAPFYTPFEFHGIFISN
jgi:carotenoid cleavage dioxygenase-like enzyme